MGLFLGVARGSSEPPRLLTFRYDPPGAPATPVLGLVGKGITFDTGGISIKPADGMERMKDDMAGGAAVACAMRAIALLRAPIRVIGVVPMTENMPGGRAIKPGDVLKSASGKTVEVINTDAEGRLILGDALWYAQQLGATHLVDVATLTGACVVALGKITSGLFGAPESWVEQVRRGRQPRGRSRVAAADLRRVPRSAEERDRRSDEHRRPPGRVDHGGAVSEGVHRRAAVGPHRHRRARRGRMKPSRTCRRARAASPCARSPSWRSPAHRGSSAGGAVLGADHRQARRAAEPRPDRPRGRPHRRPRPHRRHRPARGRPRRARRRRCCSTFAAAKRRRTPRTLRPFSEPWNPRTVEP